MSNIVKCEVCGIIMLDTEPVCGGKWGEESLCYRCYTYAEDEAEREW